MKILSQTEPRVYKRMYKRTVQDVLIEHNGKTIAVEIVQEYESDGEFTTNYKVLSRSGTMTSDETDELDEFITNHY